MIPQRRFSLNPWFLYFLKRSILQRPGRFMISTAAVGLCVSVITALVVVSLGAGNKVGAELRRYGANMMITGRDGEEIEASAAKAIRDVSDDIMDWSFQIYGQASIRGFFVEVMGTEPEHMSGYRLSGNPPRTADELMVGVDLKDCLKLAPGDKARFDGSGHAYRVTAVFEKGSDEDSVVVMPIDSARRLLRRSGVDAVLLNADSAKLSEVESAVKRSFPLLEVKTLRQVAVAEERILVRIQLLLFLVTGVVLLSSVTALSSSMGATVIERMKEIGIMKSLGATRSRIRDLFLVEAAAVGVMGGIAGYLFGVAVAEAVSKTAFGSLVPVNVLVAPFAVMVGVCVAVLSTYVPVHHAVKAAAAQTLRGE